MSNNTFKKPLAIALGAAFVGSVAGTSVVNAAENPFGMTQLSSGYMVADAHEGKCGEGKCGSKMKMKEGKCGEGKCGMAMMDADGDGKVTKDEFMAAHDEMFGKMDANGDGSVDADELKAMREAKCGEAKCGGKMEEGKCGGKMKEGKCGGNK